MTCAKQTVTAKLVTKHGTEFIGTNWCRKPQEICPRDKKGYKTGEGYHLCSEICEQSSHAEVDAIRKAGAEANGSTIYLSGHSYACDSCKSSALSVGVDKIIIVG